VLLAESGTRVLVLTAEDPEDTTSATASAMVGPHPVPQGAPPAPWDARGREVFTALASEPGTGVRLLGGTLVSHRAPPVQLTLDGQPLSGLPADELPAGYGFGFRTTLPVVDMPVYLRHLRSRLEARGGEVERRRLTHLREAGRLAPWVANCTGVGARELVADPHLEPVRGQHVLVENPGLDEFFMEAPFGEQWTGYWPHGDHVVLGSTATVGSWDRTPDLRLADGIRDRCARVEPRLGSARVIGHQVGLRPQRDPVRLAAEDVDGVRYVHHYGHGGSGVSHSWGSAEEAVALLRR
jgi:D-amino-acid oxidase